MNSFSISMFEPETSAEDEEDPYSGSAASRVLVSSPACTVTGHPPPDSRLVREPSQANMMTRCQRKIQMGLVEDNECGILNLGLYRKKKNMLLKLQVSTTYETLRQLF